MERCCKFVYRFKDIVWTKTTIIICMMPFVLSLMVLAIILLSSVESQGAVVSNSRICAKVGSKILDDGGSAVDAAIGTMLCEGIALPYGAGIGGGFSAIIRIEGNYDSIIATPTLPAGIKNVKKFDESFSNGAKSAGVPGELLGYWEMHQKYGMLSWKEIFAPTIKLCLDGIPMSGWVAGMFNHYSEKIGSSPTMSQVFPAKQRKLYKRNYKMKFPVLAKTLQKIANYGVQQFYEGEIGNAFIKDIKDAGGLITKEDLKNYKVLWNKEVPKLRMKQNLKLVSTPPPTAGAIIILIVNVVKNLDRKDIRKFWYYVVEAMKHAFHLSLTLGDAINDPTYADFIKQTYENMTNPDTARIIRQQIEKNASLPIFYDADIDNNMGKGFVNICILAPSGDIVAATSSLFETFGAYFCSLKTGIITSNLLNRFLDRKTESLTKAYTTNRPIPNKHFVTSHGPTIILDTLLRPFFIVGATGGPRGITLIANSIIKYVLLGQSAAEAISNEHLHHQFSPDRIEYENSFDSDTLDFLKNYGHKIHRTQSSYDNYTAGTCIGHRNRNPDPQYNIRVGGSKVFVKPKQELGLILVALVLALFMAASGIMLYEVLHPRRIQNIRSL